MDKLTRRDFLKKSATATSALVIGLGVATSAEGHTKDRTDICRNSINNSDLNKIVAYRDKIMIGLHGYLNDTRTHHIIDAVVRQAFVDLPIPRDSPLAFSSCSNMAAASIWGGHIFAQAVLDKDGRLVRVANMPISSVFDDGEKVRQFDFTNREWVAEFPAGLIYHGNYTKSYFGLNYNDAIIRISDISPLTDTGGVQKQITHHADIVRSRILSIIRWAEGFPR